MPLLGMTDDGQVYECDSHYDGFHGVGAVPRQVQDGNVAALSTKEDYAVIKDRIAVDQLAALKTQMQKQKMLQSQVQAAKISKAQFDKMDEYKKLNQKLSYLDNYKKSLLTSRALKTSHKAEPLNGLSGYGESGDGRNPFKDWSQTTRVQEDFGYQAEVAQIDKKAQAIKNQMRKLHNEIQYQQSKITRDIRPNLWNMAQKVR